MAKYLNLPTFLISSFIIRLLITGAGLGDALVVLSLAGLYAGHLYLEHIREPEANPELRARLSLTEAMLEKVKNKVDSMNLGSFLKK